MDGMIDGAILAMVLKYLALVGCCACWIYSVYYGTVFERRLKAKDYREIEKLNHVAMLYRNDIPKRAIEARRKVFTALTLFAALGVCLLVILFFFDTSGVAQSPFLFHDRPH